MTLRQEIRANIATWLFDKALSVEFETTLNLAEAIVDLKRGRTVGEVITLINAKETARHRRRT